MNKTYLNIQVVNYFRLFERIELERKYLFHRYFSVTFFTAFYVVKCRRTLTAKS